MNKNNIYVVLLAGGSGTRFWPLSRREEPKQFLKIIGGRSLLQETLKRVQSLTRPQNVLVVTNHLYDRNVKEQLSSFQIPPKNILLEPDGKNTAPAIAWAAARIQQSNPEGIMVVLPSDHLITQRGAFLKNLQQAVSLAQEGYLVTLGIVPTRPEAGYGYLKTKELRVGNRKIFQVEKFIEKPPLLTAQKFFKEKKYLWNSGMFIWKTAVILKNFAQFLPDIDRYFNEKSDLSSVKKIWPRLPSVSIDYGILEKAKNVVTVPAYSIGWSDLGSWEALAEISPKDKKGNILKGDIHSVECEETFVWGGRRLVATIGLKNIVIVDTPDALLVCHKTQSQKIKDVVGFLKKENRPQWIRAIRHKKS